MTRAATPPGPCPSRWRPVKRARWKVALAMHMAWQEGHRIGRISAFTEVQTLVDRLHYPQRD